MLNLSREARGLFGRAAKAFADPEGGGQGYGAPPPPQKIMKIKGS